jgi:hypothetical protein
LLEKSNCFSGLVVPNPIFPYNMMSLAGTRLRFPLSVETLPSEDEYEDMMIKHNT